MNDLMTRRFMGYVLAAACVISPVASHSQQRAANTWDYCTELPAPDPGSSPEVQQAEAALQRNDFSGAQALLQKAIAAKPDDYRAWFDLGYIYKVSQPEEAIAALRKSVALKPDFFESNFSLGFMLRDGPWPGHSTNESEKYLSAATQLTPSASAGVIDVCMGHAWVSARVDGQRGRGITVTR
jgi:tetratricopeptide (TPR) repeat protein